LNDLARTIGDRRQRRTGRMSPRKTPSRRLVLERLEDRLAPATNITVIAGAAGAGTLDNQFVTVTPGMITTADDPGDTAATLSLGALQSVGPGVTISVAADARIHFNDIGALALQTGTGVNASFTTTTGVIDFANVFNTVSTGGASLTFSAGADLTVANLDTAGGDVSLTAGTTGPAGLGGNLQFENIKTAGSGNLTFQATGGTVGTGAITQSGSSSVASGLAIAATADGNISVNSLRGTTVNLTSNKGSIMSSGSEAIQAASELILSASAGITVNTLAASLEATNTNSGGVSITQLASPAQTLNIIGSGVSNQVAGGTIFIENLGASISVAGNGIVSTSGDILLFATDFQINAQVNAGLLNTVTLANSTVGRQIDVGTNTSGKIGLTQSELNEVTASVLRIGDPGLSSGNIDVSAAITNAAG
jgi:hypothetical protein